MIFCICFCHVKGSPGGDRAPSVFRLMLLALTPRTITLPSGVLPGLPGGRSASEARDRPERLLLSARGPGPARAPSAGKGRWGKGLLEAGRAGSTPTLQKVNAQANRMPRPPPKAAKTDRVLRPKGGLGNGAPTEGTPSARRGITAFRLRVPAQPVTVCSFTYLRLVLIVYTALCFCRVNVCSSHQSLPATYVLFGQGR